MRRMLKMAGFAGLFALMLLGTTGTPRCEETLGSGPIPGEKDFNGIAYRSGGIGLDEREALQKFEYQYTLKLVFSTEDGKYMAQVPVVIHDGTGKTVLEATSQGPWLYARLPAGKYSVEAWNREDKKTKTVRVGTSGLTTVNFAWTLFAPRP